ncbi:DUF3329 domain-containing protein [Amaricoccus sp.]|uniref:DUF3329 domain-containing protein n=1 Tax=Amaricoccus sp. TaxID=1872485 RepID=UPI001B6A9504|nr:DUF3329 domain-containing protein [Amaricoccus sp.]MBP7000357.1 DUF3329 domain-containing protein [Amaricoccus sp.]
MSHGFFDLDHPFFRPLWIRAGIVVLCGVWAGLEAFTGSIAWAILFGALGVYAAWRFFVTFNPREKP